MAFRIKRDAGLEQTPRSRRPRTRRGLPPTTARTAGRAANTSSTTHRSAASTTGRGSCAGPRAARARARARRCPPGRSRSIIKRRCRRSSGRRGRVPYPLRCRPPPGTRLCGFVVGGPILEERVKAPGNNKRRSRADRAPPRRHRRVPSSSRRTPRRGGRCRPGFWPGPRPSPCAAS